MKRTSITPRVNWEDKIEELGFGLSYTSEGLYWDESAYYFFTSREVDEMEQATAELFSRCLDAVQYVIDRKLYSQFHIPEHFIPLIEKSWDEEYPSIYGRFDFSYDGIHPPKLLEFNGDTPTSLYEASVLQWFWLEDVFGQKSYDQFNSIHEKLIACWTDLKNYLHPSPLYLACVQDDLEDFTTASYLRDTAVQAGLQTQTLFMNEIGFNHETGKLVDLQDNEIRNIFKLYPWEWLAHEEFGPALSADRNSFWIEPAWKMLVSNKALLPILWQLFPGHPNLLEAYFDKPAHMGSYVKKPLLSREGSNISIYQNHQLIEQRGGEYGEEGYIYQELKELPCFDGMYPVIGSWVIACEPAGIGIRETKSRITDNYSRFIPHFFK